MRQPKKLRHRALGDHLPCLGLQNEPLKMVPFRHQSTSLFNADPTAGIYKGDKALRRYGATVERALGSWEVSPQEWADYIAFLGRLLKVIIVL